MLLRKLFYIVKPCMPRRIQLMLRRARIQVLKAKYRDVWPIYPPAGLQPNLRTKWPEDKQFALILTHDVEIKKGYDKSRQLIHLEQSIGFHSAFYFVPGRYNVLPELHKYIINNEFEVGIHGLYHDGKLYNDLNTFQKRREIINEYLKQWKACGFSSPCSHHNLELATTLDIKYSISTYDTDPFEPQGGGIGTIFPFLVINTKTGHQYVEIPYTLPQDFALFVLMREKNIDIWKQKLDWIAQCGGLVHLKTHPDYMSFESIPTGPEEYPVSYYYDLLCYIQKKYRGQYWHVLPKTMADFCMTDISRASSALMPINSGILCSSCKSIIEQKKVFLLIPKVAKKQLMLKRRFRL